MRNTFIFLVILIFEFFFISCEGKQEIKQLKPSVKYSLVEKDSIIDKVMIAVYKIGINTQIRRDVLDSAIIEYPTIAYFYQQRAMPLYKQDKDELGLPFLEKAAELNPEKYLDYMAFMKCVFSKNYEASIIDFKKVLENYGDGYVMDHTYYFYIGISYLQLNEFEKAKIFLEKSIQQTEFESGKEWIHYLDLMYLGIVKMELKEFNLAILNFDEALFQYENFSDAKYYKAICLYSLGKTEEAKTTMDEAILDLSSENTINEDNVVYERYPYQIRKSWFGLDR